MYCFQMRLHNSPAPYTIYTRTFLLSIRRPRHFNFKFNMRKTHLLRRYNSHRECDKTHGENVRTPMCYLLQVCFI